MAYNGAHLQGGGAGGQASTAPYFVNNGSIRGRDRAPDYRYPSTEDYAPRSSGSSSQEMSGGARTSVESDYGYGYPTAASTKPSPPKRESAVQRLKRRSKRLDDENAALRQDKEQVQHELQHYKDRVTRAEESHRLEIQRLKKEVEYHKRLRLGSDQRALELEGKLMQQLRHTRSFDDNQRLEAEAALLLHTRNAELSNRVKDLEVQVSQLQELKTCLEEQLDGALCEKEQLEDELEKAHERAANGSSHLFGLRALKIDEDEADGEVEEEDDDEPGDAAGKQSGS